MIDLLTLSSGEGANYLNGCRGKLNASLPPSEQVSDDHIVMLVVQEGAIEHKECHPGNEFHYLTFSNLCRKAMAQRGGQILSPEHDGKVLALACAWFSPGKATPAVIAASSIHRRLQRRNDLYRPPWMHEMHARIVIATWEQGACRLLQTAKKGHTVVAKELWEELPRSLRRLARTIRMHPPDFKEATARLVEGAEKRIRNVLDKYQARTKTTEYVFEEQ